ncbi:Homeodomain-like protein [Macrophomina phaseolina]|uniref:Homeodomain-like protein n=1 Tax=Macrophomina phaseolina TaxID=35725 RepID=A0ABQ8G5H9_9PEZI|nr:Homeodomain-like protein [Macrophomina phaseolina]
MSTTAPRQRVWWTDDEDRVLRAEAELQAAQFGQLKDWNAVASKLPGRTNKDCRKRWSKLSGAMRKGAWTAGEDARLQAAVDRVGLRWTLVAEAVGSRHADQCAKRWQNFLDPGLERSEWTRADDERLLAAVAAHGHSWTLIRDTCLPGRSATDLKNRHTKLGRERSRRAAQSEGGSSRSSCEPAGGGGGAAAADGDAAMSASDPALLAAGGDAFALELMQGAAGAPEPVPPWALPGLDQLSLPLDFAADLHPGWTPPRPPGNKVTLIIEDVQSDAVGHVINALFTANVKVKIRVVGDDALPT